VYWSGAAIIAGTTKSNFSLHHFYGEKSMEYVDRATIRIAGETKLGVKLNQGGTIVYVYKSKRMDCVGVCYTNEDFSVCGEIRDIRINK